MSIDAQLDRVTQFTRVYNAILEEGINSMGRHRLPHHGEPTKLVFVFKASDGYVAFYMPRLPESDRRDGYYAYDVSQYDLNRLCQTVSVHHLKVASPHLGGSWDRFDVNPPDVELIPELAVPWIQEDVRRACVARALTSLPGMTVGPIVYVSSGIQKQVEPARRSFWAPVFDFEGLGARRLYHWTHADFWWMPEKLEISPRIARETAEADLTALRILSSAPGLLGTRKDEEDTPTCAAAILEEKCDELNALVNQQTSEEVLHRWLNQPEHHVFLDPNQVTVRSKVPFGSKVSDFVVRRSDDTYLLIEIERAGARIFRERNSEPTAEFNHACQQVRDWQRFIRDNVQTVRSELALADIDNPAGAVFIGRSTDITESDARTRWRDLKVRHGLDVFTYDEIIQRARALASSLRSLLKKSGRI